jgi:hypothetical protein
VGLTKLSGGVRFDGSRDGGTGALWRLVGDGSCTGSDRAVRALGGMPMEKKGMESSSASPRFGERLVAMEVLCWPKKIEDERGGAASYRRPGGRGSRRGPAPYHERYQAAVAACCSPAARSDLTLARREQRRETLRVGRPS